MELDLNLVSMVKDAYKANGFEPPDMAEKCMHTVAAELAVRKQEVADLIEDAFRANGLEAPEWTGKPIHEIASEFAMRKPGVPTRKRKRTAEA